MSFHYCTDNNHIANVTERKDLGILFNMQLNIERHIKIGEVKYNGLFFKRVFTEFSDPNSFKSKFSVHVRFI